MKILILGAAGMIGRKLAHALQTDNQLSSSSDSLILHDVVMPASVQGQMECTTLSGNLSYPAQAEALAALRPDVIFHLASIVSGEAERDFDLGWQVNMKGGWQFIEALRHQHDESKGAYRPKIIFASSIAIFGPPFPQAIDDDFLAAPQTSYGAQKPLWNCSSLIMRAKALLMGCPSACQPFVCAPASLMLLPLAFFQALSESRLTGLRRFYPCRHQCVIGMPHHVRLLGL